LDWKRRKKVKVFLSELHKSQDKRADQGL